MSEGVKTWTQDGVEFNQMLKVIVGFMSKKKYWLLEESEKNKNMNRLEKLTQAYTGEIELKLRDLEPFIGPWSVNNKIKS